MDRVQLLLVGLPLFLFCTDVINLFGSRPPPKSTSHHHHHPVHRPQPHPSAQQTLDLHTEHRSNDVFGTGSVGVGHTVSIDFCSSCSYRVDCPHFYMLKNGYLDKEAKTYCLEWGDVNTSNSSAILEERGACYNISIHLMNMARKLLMKWTSSRIF